jgi:heptosyltransferase-2
VARAERGGSVTASAADGAPLLIVRFGSLGDVVLTFAAGAALYRAHPRRPIHYLVKSEYADLVRAQPWAREVLALGDEERDVAGAHRWRERLHRTKWSGVLDLQDNPRSRFLTDGIGAPLVRWRRAGLARRAWVWTRPLRSLGYRPPPLRRAWRRYLDAARHFGAGDESAPSVHVPSEAGARLDPWWQARWGDRPVIALVPAAAWPTKEWPEEHNVALARALAGEGLGCCVISTDEERARLSRLREFVDGEPGAGWWIGSLLEVAAALARSRVVVAPDSGLLHLAAAAGRPVVAIFGSTVPQLGFAPAAVESVIAERDLGCRPCSVHGRIRCPLGHHGCMRRIEPPGILEAVRRLAARSR